MESDDVEQRLFRLFWESDALREEPEFAGLYFPCKRTLEAAARTFPRFKRRIQRASKRNTEAAQIAYGEYRIAVLDDLDTPQFREELYRRLTQCRDRFLSGQDVDSLQMSVVVSGAIRSGSTETGEDKLPLGLIGLVTAIYEASFDRGMETVEDARDLIGDDLYDLWCAVRRSEDLDVISAAVEEVAGSGHPTAFEELIEWVEADTDLTLAWERQEAHLIEDLSLLTTPGNLSFKPFPFKAEVKLVMDRIEQRRLSKPWHLGRYFPMLIMPSLASCTLETLDEHVTPAKIDTLAEAFKAIGQRLLESDDEESWAWVQNLVAAVRHMRRETVPSRNAVVRLMFSYSFVATLAGAEGADPPSPVWQRLVRRLDRSILVRMLMPNVSQAAERGTGL